MPGTIHAFDLLRKPPAELRGICPVFGDQRFLQKLVVDCIIESLSPENPAFAAARLDGETVGWAEVNDQLATQTLFGGRQPIVVVDNADDFVKHHRENLETLQQDSRSDGLLILIVSSWPGNTRLFKAIENRGWQVNCEAPAIKRGNSKQRDDQKIIQWLILWARVRHEFDLPGQAAEMLIDLTECNFGRMDQELAKLALYVDRNGKLDHRLVRQVVGGFSVQTMWETIEAATAGNAGKALDLLDQLVRSGEHPLAMFGQLSWSLRRYAQVGEIMARQERQGKKPDLGAAVKAAGFRPWGGEIEKAQNRIQKLGRRRLRLMSDWILDADLALKRSHSQEQRGRLVLERLLVQLSDELSSNPKTNSARK
jgi:DNA polymerase-3 subunit delta